jgi:hypothetical protein
VDISRAGRRIDQSVAELGLVGRPSRQNTRKAGKISAGKPLLDSRPAHSRESVPALPRTKLIRRRMATTTATPFDILYGIDIRVEERHPLKHPFYQAWTASTLSMQALRDYAGQYCHHVAAFPTYVSAVHSQTDDLTIRRHSSPKPHRRRSWFASPSRAGDGIRREIRASHAGRFNRLSCGLRGAPQRQILTGCLTPQENEPCSRAADGVLDLLWNLLSAVCTRHASLSSFAVRRLTAAHNQREDEIPRQFRLRHSLLIGLVNRNIGIPFGEFQESPATRAIPSRSWCRSPQSDHTPVFSGGALENPPPPKRLFRNLALSIQ